MLKKKLNILFFILLSAFFLGSFSTSYAYTFDDLLDYATQIQERNDAPTYIKRASTTLLNRQNFIRQNMASNFNLNNIKSIFVWLRDTDSGSITVFVTFNSGYYSRSGNSINMGTNVYEFRISASSSSDWYFYGQVGSSVYIDQTRYFGLLDNTNSNIDYTGFWLNNNYRSEPDVYFVPDKDYTVTYKGHSGVNCMLRNWSIQQWWLGNTVDFSTLSSYNMFLYDLTYNAEIGTVYGSNETETVHGSNALYFDRGHLYANSRYMHHNTLYRLYIQKFIDGEQYDEEHYFVFLPRNATVENGVITDFGSGDFTVQDSTNAIIDNQESGDAQIIGALTSTTIPSGEEPTIDDLASITIPDKDDPSHEFFTWLLNQIILVLEDDSEQTLVIPIYDTSYEIRSDVFKLEIEPLRTFIQAGWWFIVGVPFLKYIRRCIEKLKGGEIPASDDKSDLLGNVL